MVRLGVTGIRGRETGWSRGKRGAFLRQAIPSFLREKPVYTNRGAEQIRRTEVPFSSRIRNYLSGDCFGGTTYRGILGRVRGDALI